MAAAELDSELESALPLAVETDRWEMAYQQLLSAVPPEHAACVQRLLESLHNGGCGLREWVNAIAWRGAVCPPVIPSVLIEVYISDPEAVPLHDCEACGLAVPVRPNRLRGLEAEPEQIYFPSCPSCGGRTGWYLYWSTQSGHDPIASALRRKAR